MVTEEQLEKGVNCRGMCNICKDVDKCAQFKHAVQTSIVHCTACNKECSSVFIRSEMTHGAREDYVRNTEYCSEKCATGVTSGSSFAYGAMMAELTKMEKEFPSGCACAIDGMKHYINESMKRMSDVRVVQVR